jgi:hypothetical protein
MEALIEWHKRFWDETSGHTPAQVAQAEARLGLQLPTSLRRLYLETSVGGGVMAAIRSLERLEVLDSFLVFADQEQATGWWGIDVAEVKAADPRLHCTIEGKIVVDNCRLEAFLRYVVVLERCFAEPCVSEGPSDVTDLEEWKPISCPSLVWEGLEPLLVRGDAVADPNSAWALGAKTDQGLVEAIEALGGDPIDGFWWPTKP